MFTHKRELEDLRRRVEKLEQQFCKVTEAKSNNLKRLVYTNDGRVDPEASAVAIGRTLHDIMSSSWPRDSAEARIDYALRSAKPGKGGMISRQQWLDANPQQLELFSR